MSVLSWIISSYHKLRGDLPAPLPVRDNTMSREDLLAKFINKQGKGLEIGPSHNPLAPKRKGYQVDIIDHLSQQELLIKYQDHGVDLSKIEEVDFVWKGEKYTQLTQKKDHYDWIIASHVIEHSTDFIGFINDCAELLNDKGVLFLIIPDKRFCFDHYRPVSGLGQIIDRHLQANTIHSPGVVAEYFLNVVSKNNYPCWDINSSGDFKFIHTLKEATQAMNNVIKNQVFLDVHAWCFVPHSFRLMIHDLNNLGLINLKEHLFVNTQGCEFYNILSKNNNNPDISRQQLLEKIAEELKI